MMNKILSEAQIAALRPAIHNHVTLLTASGVLPEEALAIAAEAAALCHSELCDEVLEKAFAALGVEPRVVEVKAGATDDGTT